jgi:alpha-L-arabinofuranosidase
MEDAVALGSLLITILRNCDLVKIACLSELVNCISHIRSAPAVAAGYCHPIMLSCTFQGMAAERCSIRASIRQSTTARIIRTYLIWMPFQC